MSRRTALLAITSFAMIASFGAAAAAESCFDQVRRLAERHGIATDPPTASPDSGVTMEELARSGGVVEPPPTPDKSVIPPPAGQRYGMPTLPEAAPKRQEPTAAPDKTTLQAILVAARAQAERGNEAGCREGLVKARRLIERAD